MAKTPRLYSRLTRSPVSLGSYSSLWLGPDHVLQVTSTGYNERYQRFYFGDIQAFIIGRSSRRLIWNFIWGVPALFALIRLVVTLTEEETPVASAIVLGIASVFLTLNNVLGPTCRVHLMSKVQTVRLPALARRRRAERLLGRLQPLIEAAQADLVAEIPVEAAVEAPPKL